MENTFTGCPEGKSVAKPQPLLDIRESTTRHGPIGKQVLVTAVLKAPLVRVRHHCNEYG